MSHTGEEDGGHCPTVLHPSVIKQASVRKSFVFCLFSVVLYSCHISRGGGVNRLLLLGRYLMALLVYCRKELTNNKSSVVGKSQTASQWKLALETSFLVEEE